MEQETVSENLKSLENDFEKEKQIRIDTCRKYDEQSKRLEHMNQMMNDLLSKSAQQTVESNE